MSREVLTRGGPLRGIEALVAIGIETFNERDVGFSATHRRTLSQGKSASQKQGGSEQRARPSHGLGKDYLVRIHWASD
jgi:hypothetical protein